MAYLLLGLATLVTSLHMCNTGHGQVKKAVEQRRYRTVVRLSDCPCSYGDADGGYLKFSVGIIGLLLAGVCLTGDTALQGAVAQSPQVPRPICATAGLRISFAQVPEDAIGRLGNKDR